MSKDGDKLLFSLSEALNSNTLVEQLALESTDTITSNVNVADVVPIRSGATQDSFEIGVIGNEMFVSYDTPYLVDFESAGGKLTRGRYYKNVTGQDEWLNKYFDEKFEKYGARKIDEIISRKLKRG